MTFGKKRQLLTAGTQAGDFRLPRLDGGEIALHEIMAQGPALLAFFKVSCPVCQLTFPYLQRIHTPGRLPIYGISQDDAADTADFNGRFAVSFPTLLDSAKNGYPVSNAFGISSVPTLFLLEGGGTVSRVIEGWRKTEMQSLGTLAGVQTFGKTDVVPEWKAG